MLRKRFAKQAVSVILIVVTVIMMTAAGAAEEPDFYGIGLEVARVLDEMTQSRDFLGLFFQDNILNAIETHLNSGDYSTPSAVYRLKLPDPLEWLLIQVPESSKIFTSLSPVLKEQLLVRMRGVAMMANMYNAGKGSEIYAATSLLQAVLDKPGLEVEEPEYYLFIFDKGVPVLVSYGWHQAKGQFLLLDDALKGSRDLIQSALNLFDVEVIPVDIP